MRIFSRQGPAYSPLDDSHEDQDDVPLDHIHEPDLEEQSSGSEPSDGHIRLPNINVSITSFVKLRLTSRGKQVVSVLVSILCLLMVVGVSVKLGYYTVFQHKPSPVIDKSYKAFRIPNHIASLHNGAFHNARRNNTSFQHLRYENLRWAYGGSYGRLRRALHPARSPKSNIGADRPTARKRRSYYGNSYVYALSPQSEPIWNMQVVFMVGDDSNIFTKDKLEKIHDIELKIMRHKRYSDFCFKDSSRATILDDPAIKANSGCTPLNSLLTYFFPSKDGSGKVYYDGLGENIVNIDSALKLAMQSTNFYYYVDEKVNTSNRNSQLLRTEVLFGAPLKGFQSLDIDREEQSKRFKEFVVTYIDLLSKESTSDLSVLYGGQEIYDYEVEVTFWSDVKLAVYALVAIFVLMLVLTWGSLWLTFWGIVSILLSAPLAIFFYRVVFNVVGLGILNGAAAFVIIGIGVDDVFVFINIFRQANHLSDGRARTWYTVKTAGVSTFFTSFTTAAAFAANLASMIPAVHDFGLFMALIVANCWLTVMLVMPPALYIWYISFRKWEAWIASCLCLRVPSCCNCCNTPLPDDIACFMDHSHGSISQVTLSREVTEEDDDVPMLSIEAPSQYGGDDEGLISLDPDPLILPGEDPQPATKNNNSVGERLQAVMYRYLALPIIKARWVVIGISTVLVIVCIGLTTQLHTSTEPPQFFRADTNMQKLLNLKARFSAIETMHCRQCSAIYSIGQTTYPTDSSPIFRTQFTPKQDEIKTVHTPATPRPVPVTKETANSTTRPLRTTRTLPTTAHRETWAPEPIIPDTPAPPHRPVATPKWTFPSNWMTRKPPVTPKPTAKSVPTNFDVCKDRDCTQLKERPLLESGATVYVVLGVKDFKWSKNNLGHVMSDDVGQLKFDSQFSSLFNFSNPKILEGMKQLCMLCKNISENWELVRHGSAQCLPTDTIFPTVKKILIDSVPECRNLPKISTVYHHQQPAHVVGGLTRDGTAILWLGFAFESTTSKGKSYFEAFKEYQKWEKFLSVLRKQLPPGSPLQHMFQTSDFWPEVLMEIVAVNSAIYSVALSMIICLVSVMLFTRHFMLLLIIFLSIGEMVCVVVAIFYILGWEIGGVEAISLSILVGSSVDYCVHLVEGYILAAQACPFKDNAAKARQWRSSAAFSHIGVSIICSALTTIIAAIPLTQTTIQPFAKFGQIIAINTTVCIVFSLTVCVALLSVIAPAYFRPTWKSTLKSIVGVTVAVGASVLTLFILSMNGVNIPGPNGGSLFPH